MVARVLLVLIGGVFLAHLLYFALGTPFTALEAVSAEGGTAYLFLRGVSSAAAGSDAVMVGRGFSILCALTGLILLARLCETWSGDAVIGAALPVGFILFPPTAFTFAMATPHALLMVLSVIGLRAATVRNNRPEIWSAMKVGGVSGFLPFLDPTGFGLSGALLMVAWAEHRSVRQALVSGALAASVMALLMLVFPLSPLAALSSGLVERGVTTIENGLFLSFAMLWVALIFSVAALALSKSLRQSIGSTAVRRSVVLGAAFVLTFLWLIFGAAQRPADYPITFNTILVFGLVAALPMVMWIRLVMPAIRSVWIWILLPVVMYSCFWVILGPIDLAGFPYNQITP
jgi:hypothetical protein